MSEPSQYQKNTSRKEPGETQYKAQNSENHTCITSTSKRAHEDSHPQVEENNSTCGDFQWLKMWDTVIESNYYYNPRTGEASWFCPDDL